MPPCSTRTLPRRGCEEFVRCAAMEMDSTGYFASVSLANDPRWRSGSIYLFGLDTYGYTFFSGSPVDLWIGSELSSSDTGGFEGRNVLGVADAFGETFLYYSQRNPSTGQSQRKVTFCQEDHLLRGSGADRGRLLPG